MITFKEVVMFKFFAKLGKRWLRKWAAGKLIPRLQHVVNGGAPNVDRAMDARIKAEVLGLIDEI